MKHRFFKIPVHGGEAEAELNQFVVSHRTVGFDREFVDNGADSFWAICLRYVDGNEPQPLQRKGKVDYRDVLNEAEFVVFAKLRSLRKELSEREGLPPYALFTNEQLAAMVRQQTRTKTEMAKIEGIGQARLDKYAEAFLAVLQDAGNNLPACAPTGGEP